MCLNFNNSAKSSSNSTIRGSFEILMTSRFQNCPWVSDFMKIWWRKRVETLVAKWIISTVLLNSSLTVLMVFIKQFSNFYMLFELPYFRSICTWIISMSRHTDKMFMSLKKVEIFRFCKHIIFYLLSKANSQYCQKHVTYWRSWDSQRIWYWYYKKVFLKKSIKMNFL